MKNLAITALACATAALSACAPADHVTRGDAAAFVFDQQAQDTALPIQQATALSLRTRKIMQSSTRGGAMFGAAIGCGQTKGIAAKRQCLHAATGGAVRRSTRVDRPNSLVGSAELIRDIRAAETHLETLVKGLPSHLAAQDAKVRRNRIALKAQSMSQGAFLQHYDIVQRDRLALAEALTRTEKQTRAAHRNLINADAKRSYGLDGPIARLDKIASQAALARRTLALD